MGGTAERGPAASAPSPPPPPAGSLGSTAASRLAASLPATSRTRVLRRWCNALSAQLPQVRETLSLHSAVNANARQARGLLEVLAVGFDEALVSLGAAELHALLNPPRGAGEKELTAIVEGALGVYAAKKAAAADEVEGTLEAAGDSGGTRGETGVV